MKKVLFILLFICSIAHAQIPVGAIAKTAFISSKVARFRDSVYTVTSSPNLYADTNKYFSLMTFWRGILRANLDTCFYTLNPFLYIENKSEAVNREFIFNQGSFFNACAIQSFGSPTINNNGITYNGINQYSRLIGPSGASPRYILETLYGRSSTDTLANTNINFDLFAKDSLSNVLVGALGTSPVQWTYNFAGGSGAAYADEMYNSTTKQGRIVRVYSSAKSASGLHSQNRNRLVHEVYIRGALDTSYTNSSYNFSFARDINNEITLQALPTFSYYNAAILQYFAIRKRGFTNSEMIIYNNLVTALQQRLGRY